MLYSLLADVVVVVHLGFILFVVCGALLVKRQRWIALLHIPAALWGILIEFNNWICPLTPLENYFRRLAGQAGYSGGFIEQYLIPIIYPTHLTPTIQMLLGVIVIAINLGAYGWILYRLKKSAVSNSQRR